MWLAPSLPEGAVFGHGGRLSLEVVRTFSKNGRAALVKYRDGQPVLIPLECESLKAAP